MLELFLAPFVFTKNPKIFSEHQNPLKNNFEHLSRQSLAGTKVQNAYDR